MIDEVTCSFKAGLKWPREYEPQFTSLHKLMAMHNAILWLEQAARGEVPHGGEWPVDTSKSNNDYTVEERPGRND